LLGKPKFNNLIGNERKKIVPKLYRGPGTDWVSHDGKAMRTPITVKIKPRHPPFDPRSAEMHIHHGLAHCLMFIKLLPSAIWGIGEDRHFEVVSFEF
jgi:hypothetical protein